MTTRMNYSEDEVEIVEDGSNPVKDESEEKVTLLQEVLRDLPIDLVQNLPTVVARLNAFITFYSTLNLKRLSRLTDYVIKAEEVLFDENNILSMDEKQLRASYQQAKSASLEILDVARKVAVQLPQEEVANKDVDEVYRLLQNLSPESLSELKDTLLGNK